MQNRQIRRRSNIREEEEIEQKEVSRANEEKEEKTKGDWFQLQLDENKRERRSLLLCVQMLSKTYCNHPVGRSAAAAAKKRKGEKENRLRVIAAKQAKIKYRLRHHRVLRVSLFPRWLACVRAPCLVAYIPYIKLRQLDEARGKKKQRRKL
jgi:hypothetical protein